MNLNAKVNLLTNQENLELLPDPPLGFDIANQARIKRVSISGSDYLSVDGHVALPIIAFSSEYNTLTPISIFDTVESEIGILLFTGPLIAFNLSRLTYAQLAAYLTEVDLSLTSLGSSYQFKHDYLVISESKLQDYLSRYYTTAPLWGRFCHYSVSASPYKNPNPSIVAFDVDFNNSTFASTTINQAINQYSSPERFLKFYHVLEADFDYIIAKKLQNINLSTSSYALGELIISFGKTEYERLFFILNEKINDINSLVSCLNLVIPHKSKAEVIFYTFRKDTNPLKDVASFSDVCLRGGFSQNILRSASGINASSTDSYRTFILKLTAYWIYRIRCSIAHKRIGEYILQVSDENLLVEFAEPLIREVIRQYLT